MTILEKWLQYAKVGLLALLIMVVWARPTYVHAQLAGTSGFTYTHLSGAASTQVATTPVVLHNVTVNTAGTTITLFDNAGACSTTTVGVIGAVSGTFSYDINLKNGLCVTTTGTPDLTIGVR